MRRLVSALAVALLLPGLRPAPAIAWGMEVHRHLTALALAGLPPPLSRLYASQEAFVVEHSIDPDLWRTADLRGALGPEAPNHFLNVDTLGDPPPYAGIPRQWSAFVARYGADRADRAGRLPWRTAEIYGRLVSALRTLGTGAASGADNARYLSAIVAHYVEDGHQPLHAVANYDGQLTGQRGVHGRFETELPRRAWTRLAHAPVRLRPVGPVVDFMFACIADSAAAAPRVLQADARAAVGLRRDAEGRLDYDERYYERFLRDVRPVLEERLTTAASDVASVLVAAWKDAGEPDIPASRR